MSIWKEVKIALNSTLGTSSFLPLNKMIENAKTTLSNKIDKNQSNIISNFEKGNVSTTGSGLVLKSNTIKESKIGNYDYMIEKFIPPVSGLYKVDITINYSVPEGNGYDTPDFFIWSIPVKRVLHTSKVVDVGTSVSSEDWEIVTKVCDTWSDFMNNNIGRSENFLLSEEKEKYIATKIGSFSCGYNGGVYPASETYTFYFLCEAGVPMLLYAEDDKTAPSARYRNIHSIKTIVTYGNN